MSNRENLSAQSLTHWPRGSLLVIFSLLSASACSSDSPTSATENSGSLTGLSGGSGSGSGGTQGSDTSGTASSGQVGGDDSGRVGGSGGGLEGGVNDVCGSASFAATVEEVSDHGNVLILFDQSNSMKDGFAGEPLWRAASDAVHEAIVPHQDNLTVGAVFFPTTEDAVFLCAETSVAGIDTAPQIPFQPAPDFLQAWQSRWTEANLVYSTPTERAMVVGAAALDEAGLLGGTAVILVTDGASTCYAVRPRESEDVAAEWLDEGIQTYVVGLAGFGPSGGELGSIATAGGTDRVFTPADGDELADELSRIVTELVRSRFESCRLTFEETPGNLDEIDLIVTEAASGERYRVPQGKDGWQTLPGNEGAVLQGTTCSDALGGRFSAVSFEFGCEDIPLLI